MQFPPFDLVRLLKTVFEPQIGERIAILIDLPDPEKIQNFSFLKDPSFPIQNRAHDVFYQGLKNGAMKTLGLEGGEIFAYQLSGGSNLDFSDVAYDPHGKKISLRADVYSQYDIILCISTYSATAPLTAFAKEIGFRGATLHGVNDIILASGLAVDYNQVSIQAEKLRSSMTKADFFEIDFIMEGKKYTLKLNCDGQEAQKSHGLCRGKNPDIANLPAGEVYFVPTDASGEFPHRYEEGTLAVMEVSAGKIRKSTLIRGDAKLVEAHNLKLQTDPVTGELGELGFGTQILPVSGKDIQDEKILGTMHVATGRSDHLGGHLTPDKFAIPVNATHDDLLFSPTKTPEIQVPEVRMFRDQKSIVIIQNYQPAAYLQQALQS